MARGRGRGVTSRGRGTPDRGRGAAVRGRGTTDRGRGTSGRGSRVTPYPLRQSSRATPPPELENGAPPSPLPDQQRQLIEIDLEDLMGRIRAVVREEHAAATEAGDEGDQPLLGQQPVGQAAQQTEVPPLPCSWPPVPRQGTIVTYLPSVTHYA